VNFSEFSEITPAKVDALKARIARLGIDLRLIEETFVRGGGKGGQKINKTANSVLLKYPPLGLIVRCQRERKRSLNRFLALREMVDEIEVKISPGTSERLKDMARMRKKKADKHRKALHKLEKPGMKIKALSIVFPNGSKIARGEKTIEVRSWKPGVSPDEDLLIVENRKYLRKPGETDDDGKAVALVRIKAVREYLRTDISAACASRWEPGYFSWELSDVRPLRSEKKTLAAREIYEVEFERISETERPA
jgi:hypothetical protein